MSDFRIHVAQSELDDLRRRLERTRWADSVADDDWSWGTPPAVLRPLVERWICGYDWRATERRWNAWEHHLVPVDGSSVHVARTGTRGAQPLVLIHGWPDGFLRFEKALPLLADRFDVFLPTIPGFGFSGRPTTPGWGPTRAADAFAGVMDALGVASYGVHGADVGSTVAELLAARHPDRVTGLHLGDVPAWRRYTVDPATLSPAERVFADSMTQWFQDEGAYAHQQRTKPQTLGYALTDSPVGLAAWIVEKLRAWSDCGGDVFSRFTPDEILDDVSLYWLTGTAASAARYYRESAVDALDPALRIATPTAFTLFPRDVACPPLEYAERFFDVRRFTVAPHGGHFGPWEEPELWAAEVTRFFDALR